VPVTAEQLSQRGDAGIAALLFIQFSKISGMSPPAAVSLKANFH